MFKVEVHNDYIVPELISVEACKKVLAVDIMHNYTVGKKEINIIVDNCKELVKCI